VSRYRLKTMIPPVKTWSVDLSCSIGFIPALLRHTHTKKKKEKESFCSQLPPFKAQSTDLLCQRDLVMLYEMPLLLSPAGVLRLQFSVLCFER